MSGRRGLAWNGGMSAGLCALAVVCGLAAAWSSSAAAADPAPRRAIVDPGVVPAGGLCHGCRDPHCRSCRLHHHGGCRDGKCHPHCPVRPQEFGFYGTQWRRWPGQGVVPVANVQDATPTLPPKSSVPGADEESRGPRAGELPAPEPDAVAPPAVPAPLPETEPAVPPVPRAEEPAPLVPVEPATPAAPAPEPPAAEPVAPAPPAEQPPAQEPAKEPAAKEPAGKDLFDESATGPVRRRFVVRSAAAAAEQPQPSAVRTATLTYPSSAARQVPPADGWRARVPRVSFDPAAEAARLGR